MNDRASNIILYNTADGKAQVTLYAHDGTVWLNQNQTAELFATSKQNISLHILKYYGLEIHRLDSD